MKTNKKFTNLDKEFWANIRYISQEIGYTQRDTKTVKIPLEKDLQFLFSNNNFKDSHLFNKDSTLTIFGSLVIEYFSYRAKVLNEFVESKLMDVEEAKSTFEELFSSYKPTCPIPMNKQKKEKKAPAYFTSIINMLIEKNARGHDVDYNPRKLTIFTSDNKPVRTFSRWIDGAFPSTTDPLAIWEIKEYYYTTTFGSRVADGVFETLLDGMELEELFEHTGKKALHYLMIDSHYTWWECGRAYLCRIIDMLHMGYVDEVLFGNEVLERLPEIVHEWLEKK